jgi:hypothetical protein
MKGRLTGDGEPEGVPVGTHADLTCLGCLKDVATERRFRKHKSSLPNQYVECVFDTGVVMYVPPALFDTMIFALEESE